MIEAVIDCHKDRVQWYQLETAAKIKQGFKISTAGACATECTCAKFRVARGTCQHTKFITEKGLKWDRVYRDSESPVDFTGGDMGVVLFDGTKRELVLLPPPHVGVNAFEVLKAVEKEESVVDLTGTGLDSSYARFRAEITEAFNSSLSLTNPTITAMPVEGGEVADFEARKKAWAAEAEEDKRK